MTIPMTTRTISNSISENPWLDLKVIAFTPDIVGISEIRTNEVDRGEKSVRKRCTERVLQGLNTAIATSTTALGRPPLLANSYYCVTD